MYLYSCKETPIPDLKKFHLSKHAIKRISRLDNLKEAGYTIGNPYKFFLCRSDLYDQYGEEGHLITDKGIIYIYCLKKKCLITMMAGKPSQINRYFKLSGQCAPANILNAAAAHEENC